LATEAARGDIVGGHLHDALELAFRGVAANTGAAPEGDPDAALVVHREPVGDAGAALDHDERTATGDLAACNVELEAVDPVGHRVDVVHRRAVRRPADPVRERHLVEDAVEAAVVRVAVESAVPGGV